MSQVKRYLDGKKKAGYAHDVARVVAALRANGWDDLADAINGDFEAPTYAEELADALRFPPEPATREELFEALDEIAAGFTAEQQRALAARLMCRAAGLNPDEKTTAESSAETQAEKGVDGDLPGT